MISGVLLEHLMNNYNNKNNNNNNNKYLDVHQLL